MDKPTSWRNISFYLLLLLFCEQSIQQIYSLTQGQQPRTGVASPLVLAFAQSPLVFDRDAFFAKTEWTLHYPDNSQETIRYGSPISGFHFYFENLFFWHWGHYLQFPAQADEVLQHYFCEKRSRQKIPALVRWRTASAAGHLFFSKDIKCL